MKRLKLKSPAKLNLYLKVLNRRPDGYHNILTVFERINLHDDVILRLCGSGIKVSCSAPDIPAGPANLAYKAAALLKRHSGARKGVYIKIIKRIPHGAGLGGGSSNAAVTLIGLNLLWKLKLSKEELMRLGSKIGADVGFFLTESRAAIGEGLGDKLRKVSGVRRLWHVLVMPEERLSTKDIYSRFDSLARQRFFLTQARADVTILCHALKGGDIGGIAEKLYNDLEKPASLIYSAISHIKTALNRCNCRGSLMSGSGSAVFGIFTGRKEAMGAKRKLAGMLGTKQSCRSQENSRIIVVYTL